MKMNKKNYKLVSVALALVGAYFVYRYFSSGKPTVLPTGQSPTPASSPTPQNDFPLKRGSKGKKVKELQELLLKFDKKILPRFGADSDFGSETEAALVKITGKKFVLNQNELDELKAKYNKKAFPFITPNPSSGNMPPIGGALF